MQNLDLECAKLGRELADEKGVDQKLLTSALSVLEEQGLYAFFLYLKAREGRAGEEVIRRAASFLRRMPPGARPLLGNGETFTALQSLAADMDRLLFARELLRQALVYGRYHAKTSDGGAG
jgi:hypothetical protein